MKKNLVVLVVLLTLVAFAGGAIAQTPGKPVEKQATPAAEKPKTEKPEAQKKEALKSMERAGSVGDYDANKMIKVKEQDKEMLFGVTGDTKIKGEVPGGRRII